MTYKCPLCGTTNVHLDSKTGWYLCSFPNCWGACKGATASVENVQMYINQAMRCSSDKAS